MGRGSEHYFSKGIQMTGVHTYTLTIREMQIKTTMRYHLKPVRMAIIKKKRKKNQVLAIMWRKRKPCTLLVGLSGGTATIANSVEVPPKTKHRTTT